MRPSMVHVKKHTLLAVAGCVWLIAEFNVARLGVLSYGKMQTISGIHILLSALVLCVFGFMFLKMSMKHTKRIRGYQEKWKLVWHFFDLKSYCIMAVMMGGGIWLRSSGLVPDEFIAVFYTGLGCALALAGAIFWVMFFTSKEESEIHQNVISYEEEKTNEKNI